LLTASKKKHEMFPAWRAGKGKKPGRGRGSRDWAQFVGWVESIAAARTYGSSGAARAPKSHLTTQRLWGAGGGRKKTCARKGTRTGECVYEGES